MSETKTLIIEPEITIAALVEAYPEVEGALDDLFPAYGNLKPGMVRDVIARTTTLEQAAVAADVRLPDVIGKLRGAAGLPMDASPNVPGMPLWAKEGRIKSTLDARPMLAQGQHPKGEVLQEISNLSHNEIFVLLTPFVPGPLIELARSQGAQTWTRQGERDRPNVFFERTII